MQNFTYYVLSIVAIAVYLIINYEQLSRKGEISERAARYRMFLLSILFYYLSDAAWGIFAGLKWMRAWYVDTIFFFLSLAYFVYAWSRFVIVYLHFDKIAQRFLYGCGCALLAVNVALLAANPFCDCVYYFDAQGTYVLGGMRDVLFALLIAYSALISAFIFW